MKKLSLADKSVLTSIGSWSDETIYGQHLMNLFSFKSARVSVLVVGSQLGYTRKYVYFFRWGKTTDGSFFPTAEFYDHHQASLRSCVSKLKAWEKQNTL